MQTETAKSAVQFPENLPPAWRKHLAGEVKKEYFRKLIQFLNAEYSKKAKIFPERNNIMRALQAVDYDNVKVVILGQDPYHGPDQAIGLSFAVPNDLLPKPPSLKNIFKEISSDLGIDMNGKNTDLLGWAEQGVLLLNTVLTVRAAQAFSHRDKGWEQFTDYIINLLNQRAEPIVFILWGGHARKKKVLITNKQHSILESAHPSPLSAFSGFFGSKPFSKANEILKDQGQKIIDWARTSL